MIIALDVIIWADALKDLCLQCVLSRDEWHEIMDLSINRVLSVVKCYRECYELIITKVVSQNLKQAFHFRTDQISTEQMVDQIFPDIDLGEN